MLPSFCQICSKIAYSELITVDHRKTRLDPLVFDRLITAFMTYQIVTIHYIETVLNEFGRGQQNWQTSRPFREFSAFRSQNDKQRPCQMAKNAVSADKVSEQTPPI